MEMQKLLRCPRGTIKTTMTAHNGNTVVQKEHTAALAGHLRSRGQESGLLIKEEITYRLSILKEGEPDCRYSQMEENPVCSKSVYRDVLNLSRFPIHALDAIVLFQELAHHHLEDLLDNDLFSLYRADFMDRTLLRILQRYAIHIAKARTPGQRRIPVECVDRLLSERRKCVGVTAKDECAVISKRRNPVFQESLKFIRAVQSRELGLLLTYKVAGHLLPTELVDAIAENFYDTEVLKGL